MAQAVCKRAVSTEDAPSPVASNLPEFGHHQNLRIRKRLEGINETCIFNVEVGSNLSKRKRDIYHWPYTFPFGHSHGSASGLEIVPRGIRR